MANEFLDDSQSLREIISRMPADERRQYESFGFLAKEAAFPNRRLVVYDIVSGTPANVELLNVGDLTVTRLAGPVVDIEWRGKHLDVSVEPIKLPGREVFLQVPQHFEFKWTGKWTERGVQFAPHYALLRKTRHRDEVEGHTYCVTLNKFRERFPGIPVRY